MHKEMDFSDEKRGGIKHLLSSGLLNQIQISKQFEVRHGIVSKLGKHL